MQIHRKYLITSPRSPQGFEVIYNTAGLLVGFEIKQPVQTIEYLQNTLKLLCNTQQQFNEWLNTYKGKGIVCVELVEEITFDMMWLRYNDRVRSSKKKSLKYWDKMPVAERVKAYLYYPTYEKNRGTAEKKYLTTYLSDEMWNN